MSEQKPPNAPPTLKLSELGNSLRSLAEKLQEQSAAADPAKNRLQVEYEKQTLEVERLRIDNEEARKKHAEGHDLHDTRKEYAGRLFWLIVGWLIVVVVFVLLTGFHLGGFTLSEKVLIAFITSTTVSVLGLFIVAAKWLFPSPEKSSPKPIGTLKISATQE